jgi:hypothetical protein
MENRERKENNSWNNRNSISAKFACSAVLFFCAIIILQIAAIKLVGGFLSAREIWSFSENYSRRETVSVLIIEESVFFGVLVSCLVGLIVANLRLLPIFLDCCPLSGETAIFYRAYKYSCHRIRPPTI